MSSRKCFECDKSVLLNILYDTLDRLGGRLESADSQNGEFLVCMDDATRLSIDIVPCEHTNEMLVCSVKNDDFGWASVILDEVEARRIALYGEIQMQTMKKNGCLQKIMN